MIREPRISPVMRRRLQESFERDRLKNPVKSEITTDQAFRKVGAEKEMEFYDKLRSKDRNALKEIDLEGSKIVI